MSVDRPLDPGEPDVIEFIDTTGVEVSDNVESVDTSRSRSSTWIVVGLLAAVGLGIAGLGSSGDEAAPPTTTAPASTTTEPSSPVIAEPPTVEAPTFALGAGPPLDWQRVPVSSAATDFRWIDDRFIGLDGERRLAIIPGPSGPSASADFVGRPPALSASNVVVEEDRLVFLDEFAGGFRWPPRNVRTQAPPGPVSDLITRNVDVAAELRGNDVLVLHTVTAVLNVDRFRARTGIVVDPIFSLDVGATAIRVFGNDDEATFSISDTDLDPDDIGALQMIDEPMTQLSVGPLGGTAEPVDAGLDRVDWVGVVGDEFVVGGSDLRRSSDGLTWERTSEDTPRFGGLLAPGPDGRLLGLAFEADNGFVALSSDAARSWERIASPLQNTWRLTAAEPVLVMTGWDDSPFLTSPERWTIFTPGFELQIAANDEQFELLDREGTTLLSGSTTDPSSGFRYAPGSPDIFFVDPATDEEVARFPQRLFGSSLASAQTLAGNPQMVAMADTSGSGMTQEWSVTPVNEYFGANALAVEFIAGDGWLLADVITTEGRELYTAALPS